MRISKRATVILALAAAGALATAGLALGDTAPDGNVSSVAFKVKPSKVPKTKFHKASLFVHTHTDFADPGNKPAGGSTDKVQLFIDDDIKINQHGVPTCSGNFPSGTTMAQAMAQCGTAKVGTGTAQTAPTPNSFPGCVLDFNGQGKQIVLFTRVDFSPPADCSNPSGNTGGDVSVTLFGKLKKASGDFGTQLSVDTSTTALPLGDFQSTIKRGKYVSARCHDHNKKWNVKGRHTYSDGDTATDNVKQTCKIKH
jgi:hypothetical protein